MSRNNQQRRASERRDRVRRATRSDHSRPQQHPTHDPINSRSWPGIDVDFDPYIDNPYRDRSFDEVPTAQAADDKLSALLTEVAMVSELSQRDYPLLTRHIAERDLVSRAQPRSASSTSN